MHEASDLGWCATSRVRAVCASCCTPRGDEAVSSATATGGPPWCRWDADGMQMGCKWDANGRQSNCRGDAEETQSAGICTCEMGGAEHEVTEGGEGALELLDVCLAALALVSNRRPGRPPHCEDRPHLALWVPVDLAQCTPPCSSGVCVSVGEEQRNTVRPRKKKEKSSSRSVVCRKLAIG